MIVERYVKHQYPCGGFAIFDNIEQRYISLEEYNELDKQFQANTDFVDSLFN